MAIPEAQAAEPVSDEALVDRMRAGDRRAFDALYDRYFQRVYHFIERRLRLREDAEETVQEVFINLFSSIHSFRGEAPFGAWLFGLTRRTLASRFKKKRPGLVSLGDGEADEARPVLAESRDPDPHEAYECSERLARMERAIARDLTPEQWTLFQLHHLQNQSIQEIARATAKSEDAVKSHLYRARKMLLAR